MPRPETCPDSSIQEGTIGNATSGKRGKGRDLSSTQQARPGQAPGLEPHLRLTSMEVEEDMKEVKRLTGKAPALKMVKSGLPKVASSASVGRMSMLYMNSAW